MVPPSNCCSTEPGAGPSHRNNGASTPATRLRLGTHSVGVGDYRCARCVCVGRTARQAARHWRENSLSPFVFLSCCVVREFTFGLRNPRGTISVLNVAFV
ncbi:hypothetical protein AVEN_142519-1 [Araneus ventricosus]|uniref:Uncharacterized protein n=1 Tax=Araneus ventricosus TaxID=182803 RepID=A0A4Y2CHH2_ARAVE|nr:hypothetical protein AVEN_142519-1 [Araneus ventricosus]